MTLVRLLRCDAELLELHLGRSGLDDAELGVVDHLQV